MAEHSTTVEHEEQRGEGAEEARGGREGEPPMSQRTGPDGADRRARRDCSASASAALLVAGEGHEAAGVRTM